MRRGTSVIAHAVDAQTRHRLYIGPSALPVGRERDALAVTLRIEQRQQFPLGQKVHPADAVAVVGQFMVALHREAGDTGLFQPFQPGDGVVEGERIDGAFFKEITGQQDEVDFAVDGRINNVEIGAGEVVLPLAAVVLTIAEMTVGHVEKGSAHGMSRR